MVSARENVVVDLLMNMAMEVHEEMQDKQLDKLAMRNRWFD